jgi:hypothetical protein
MIPVYQSMTVANDGTGNCFNACVASILEMPLREVCQVLPSFEGDYWGEWRKWLAPLGMTIEYLPLDQGPPKGFAIATGYGGRVYPDGHASAGKPILHAAVVFNGELVHDPFPCAKQFGDVRYYWVITSLAAEEAQAA